MKCETPGCTAGAAGIRVFEPRKNSPVYHPLLCDAHALVTLGRYTSRAANTWLPAGANPPPLIVGCVATCETSDVALVYLQGEHDFFLQLTMGKLEGRMLGNLLVRDARKNRVSTHQAMAAIIDGFGAVLRAVKIDEAGREDFQARLEIARSDQSYSVVMRASDGIALALATGVPLHAEPAIVSKSAALAANSPILKEMARTGPSSAF
jgi:bifunctional DNase/RNase